MEIIYFGLSYGNQMTGGVDNTKISNSGLGDKNAYFSSGDFRDINNWNIGNAPANETPGAANNSANQDWIDMLRAVPGTDCNLTPLPITLISFDGIYNNGKVQLTWESASEKYNNYYEVFHSQTGYDFNFIGKVDGAGNSNTTQSYQFPHRVANSGIHYYRLKSVDYDGKIYDKGTISIQVKRDKIVYDSYTQNLYFPQNSVFTLYATNGQKVMEINSKSKIHFSRQGVYLVYNHQSGVVTKIAVP